MKPDLQWLEGRRLMATVPIPTANPRVALSAIMWNGEPQPLNPGGMPNIPAPYQVGAAKTIKITNNGPDIIYPFLRGENNGIDPNATPKAPYDPQDLPNREYREYVGYTDAKGVKRLGLPSGASITIQVPLVLWDGDNLYLATDGTYLTTQKIFGYDPSASVTIVGPGQVESGTTWVQDSANYPENSTPLVMFYRSDGPPVTAPDDAPAQLTEVTFRDQYLKNFINDAKQTFPLLNYDVSYVNNLVSPVSMEASQVPITYQTNPEPAPPTYFGYQDFGWLATDANTKTFGDSIGDFVNNQGSASVGDYFGDGRGWPAFYNPNPALLSIPAGSNLFADSPLSASGSLVHTSSYDPNHWMLTSAGSAPIQAGGAGVGVQGFVKAGETNRIYIKNAPKQFVNDLNQMLQVQGSVVNVTFPGSSQVLATVKKYVSGANPYVLLNQSIDASGSSGKVYAFTRPASDYAATAITNLWYSWAQYHVQRYANFQPESAEGSLTYATIDGTSQLTNTILLSSDPPVALAPGMTVTAAAGIPEGTTILKVDGRTIYLSQIPADGTPSNQQYTFGKPLPLPYDPKFTTPYTLTFNDAETPNAQRFAASVYEALAAEAAVKPLPESYLPYSMNLVSQVIQFYANLPGYDRPYGPTLVGQIRDVVKSVLRGVYDYKAVSDQTQWYPDPSKVPDGLTSGQNFNVYNLDPYVWFVHKVQGMSAYGFSVDDDVANPTATGPLLGPNGEANHSPNNLQIDFGGTDGLGIKTQWFPTIPWGTFQTMATIYVLETGDWKNHTVVRFVGPDALKLYNMINNPGTGQVGAYISAPNYITPGTNLIFKGPTSGLIPEIVLSQGAVTTSTPIQVTITGILPTTTKSRKPDTPPRKKALVAMAAPKPAPIYGTPAAPQTTLGRVVPKGPVAALIS